MHKLKKSPKVSTNLKRKKLRRIEWVEKMYFSADKLVVLEHSKQ